MHRPGARPESGAGVYRQRREEPIDVLRVAPVVFPTYRAPHGQATINLGRELLPRVL